MTEKATRTMRIEIAPEDRRPLTARRGAAAPQALAVPAAFPRGDAEYRRLLQSIYDAVLITDSAGRIVDFNHRIQDLFLCEEGSLPHTNVIDFISGARSTLLPELLGNLGNDTHVLIEASCRRMDGSVFPAEIAVNLLDLSGGRNLSFFFRDVTVRKQALDAMEVAFARLKQHDESRSTFVDNVSHELRTPLTSMLYAIKNLLSGVAGPIPERARDYLELLDGDCRRLWSTVNDILDLRQIEDRTIALSRSGVPLAPLVAQSVAGIRIQSESKAQFLTMELGEGRWFVDVDATKMERVFINVIGNAVKFTPDGGQIRVAVRDDATREGYVEVVVDDTGIGIPAESLDRVTERYYRVGDQVTGTGLGLSISKEIVELHGGLLLITSPVPGLPGGTRVRVILPVASPPLVVLWCSSDSAAASLKAAVEKYGCRTLLVRSLDEARLALRQDRPALVVVDIAPPEDEACAFVLEAQGHRKDGKVPVLVLADETMRQARRDLLQHFAAAVVVKPWDEEGFAKAVTAVFLGRLATAR